MKQEDIRNILVVEAIEQTDRDFELLTQAERHEASRHAGAPLESQPSSSVENSFLAKRASRLLVEVASKIPESARWLHSPPNRHRLGMLTLGLSVVAVVVGFLTNELGPDKRINILSFPLLGILAWSLVVYVRELILLFRSRERLFNDNWVNLLVRYCLPSPPASEKENGPLEAARHLFHSRWQKLLIPAVGARIKSVLHLVALLLAAAAIAGMYVKGLASEYRAVWESTFFTEPEQLQPFIQGVLGPAAALKGDSFPTADDLRAMQWTADSDPVAGAPAAPWIHWYALTIALYVLIPRAILSVVWRLRSARLNRTIPFREVEPKYFEHLLATSTGEATRIRFLPYPASPSEESQSDLEDFLEHELERAVDGKWEDAVPFGEEESFELAEPHVSDEYILVFSFSATPERESHLALFQNLQGQTKGRIRRIVLDSAAFDRKNGSLPDAEERREARMSAWENLLREEEVDLLLGGNHAMSHRVTAD